MICCFYTILNNDQVTCLILVHIFYGVIALILLLCHICPVHHYKLSDDLLKRIEHISRSLSSSWFLSFFSCDDPNHPFLSYSYMCPHSLCSLGLSANQPAVLFSHIKSAPATSQSAVLLSHNKSAPAISHSQTNTAIVQCSKTKQMMTI